MTTAPINKPTMPESIIPPMAPTNIMARGASTPLANNMGFNTLFSKPTAIFQTKNATAAPVPVSVLENT